MWCCSKFFRPLPFWSGASTIVGTVGMTTTLNRHDITLSFIKIDQTIYSIFFVTRIPLVSKINTFNISWSLLVKFKLNLYFWLCREFEHGRASSGVEVAAEVVERSSSPSDHSVTSSCRRRDVVRTFFLSTTFLFHLFQSYILFQCITADEGNIRKTGVRITVENNESCI